MPPYRPVTLVEACEKLSVKLCIESSIGPIMWKGCPTALTVAHFRNPYFTRLLNKLFIVVELRRTFIDEKLPCQFE